MTHATILSRIDTLQAQARQINDELDLLRSIILGEGIRNAGSSKERVKAVLLVVGGLTGHDWNTRSRRRDGFVARMAAAVLLTVDCGLSTTTTARAVGYSDHTGTLYAIKRWENIPEVMSVVYRSREVLTNRTASWNGMEQAAS